MKIEDKRIFELYLPETNFIAQSKTQYFNDNYDHYMDIFFHKSALVYPYGACFIELDHRVFQFQQGFLHADLELEVDEWNQFHHGILYWLHMGED